MPTTKTISDVWKWVAVGAVTWIMGAGTTTILGKAALANHIIATEEAQVEREEEEKEAQAKKAEVEKDLHMMQADVHNRLVDMIEDNEKLLNELRVGQAEVAAKLELILNQELDRHHRNDNVDNN